MGLYDGFVDELEKLAGVPRYLKGKLSGSISYVGQRIKAHRKGHEAAKELAKRHAALHGPTTEKDWGPYPTWEKHTTTARYKKVDGGLARMGSRLTLESKKNER